MSAAPPPRAGALAGGTTGRGTFGGAGWLIGVALALVTVAFGLHVASLLSHRGSRAVGDGRHVESYGFSLAGLDVDRRLLVAGGMPRDGLPALTDPPVWTTGQADAATTRESKFLVPGDRVIGVRIGGQERAYPLRLLVWHEVVNDTLGGIAVAVTYNPLCDSAVAFRRERAGGTLEFGVSGLLYQSNLVLYDRASPPGRPSLWSQLLMRAIAGPAAGAALEPLAISVEPWSAWRRRWPETTVLAPDPRLAEQYRRDPYASYFGSDELRFPVAPLPPAEAYPLKTPVVAFGGSGGWTAVPLPAIAALARAAAAPTGRLREMWPALAYLPEASAVAVDDRRLPPGVAVAYASYFAWFATHRGDTTWVGEATGDGTAR